MAVCAPRHAGQTRDEVVVRDADLERLGGPGGKGDRAHPHREQAGAALGPRLVIGLDAFAAMAIGLGEIGAHRRHHDAIAQLEGADASREQQTRERMGHGR